MRSNDTHLPLEVTLAQLSGELDLDPMLIGCPACGAKELRSEVRAVWRPISEAAQYYGPLTAADIRAAGGTVDAFGTRVKCAVPYVSCMACGADFDASKDPVL